MSVHSVETQGRVQSIKSKFENLNSFESLDISTTAATTPSLLNTHQWKSSPKFLFKRSLTTIDFRSKYKNNIIATGNGMDSKNNNNKSLAITTRATRTSASSPVNDVNHDEIKKSSYLRRHNNLDRTVSADTYSIRKRTNNNQTSAEDTLKPLKELKENVEVRLTRHTNDPIKRSSIKRSPAFRVGASDKCNNSINGNASKTNEKTHQNNNNNNNKDNNNNKNNNNNNNNDAKMESIADQVPKVAKQMKMPKVPKVPKEFSNKINEVLKRCDNDKLNEPGLTDTLKAFLRQPLPDGPAPKKPPRTFQANNNHESSNEIKQKIDLLENQLVFKQTKTTSAAAAAATKTPSPSSQKTKIWRSAKDKSSNLLNCIVPCSSTAIYDSMIVDNNSPIKMLSTAINEAKLQNSEQTILLTNKSQLTIQQRRPPNGIRKSPAEHIYMEPFAHLKSNNKCNGLTSSSSSPSVPSSSSSSSSSSSPSSPPTQTAPTTMTTTTNTTTTTTTSTMHNDSNNQCRNHSVSPTLSNQANTDANGSIDGDSLGSSLVSCTSCTADDHSVTDLHDIHYMCTSIENKIKSSESDSNSNEIDHSTLKTTYDEINSFVNAAFDQQHKTNDKMGNTMDTYELSAAMSNSNPLTSASTLNACNETIKTVKLCRTLTEKRKDYVRRISNVRNIPEAILKKDSKMHQTFKPAVFRTFSADNTDNSDQMVDSLNNNTNGKPQVNDENLANQPKAHCDGMAMDTVDGCCHTQSDENENENAPKLFQVCLLIGYNSSTRQAYIKSKFPIDEDVPPNIEQLVFPSPNLMNQTQSNQDYSIVLTDNEGYHVYGYCRRVLPEGCQTCLPLAYCLISEVKAPGFYFKILREIETRHGQAEFQTNFLLQNLQNRSIPEAGKLLHLKLPMSPKPKTITTSLHKIHTTPKRLSLEVNPKWLTESAAQAAFNNNNNMAETSTNDTQITTKKEHRSSPKSLVQEFEEKKLNNVCGNGAPFDLSLINRSLLNGRGKCDEIVIQRPNDLRLESTELSDLYKALGPELLIVVFSSLLLERKVILYTENISILSSCVLGLQTLLYPFEWQHALITILPQNLAEICQAPIPVLAGMLEPITFDIEDGIVIDLNNRMLVQKCGDEQTILPSSLIKSLKISLEMVDLLHQGKMLSSVLTAEAFLRCFVELFKGFNSKYFHKKLFIESHSSQSYRLFLEWFVETAMFRHFIQKRFPTKIENASDVDPVAGINDKFYDLFDSRIYKSDNDLAGTQQGIEAYKKNFRDINKKTRTFKDRFKDFISSSNHNSHNNNNNN